jgi:hypothetical protein
MRRWNGWGDDSFSLELPRTGEEFLAAIAKMMQVNAVFHLYPASQALYQQLYNEVYLEIYPQLHGACTNNPPHYLVARANIPYG